MTNKKGIDGKLLSDMSLEELWELFPIVLKAYNSAYTVWYAEEKANLEQVIGKQYIKRINHIGSSSVKGLIGKPTVDILLEIEDDYNIEQLKEVLHHAGWLLMSSEIESDLKLSFNKGYTFAGFADKVFHLHIRHFGNWSELYFRDYLVDHKDIAAEYGKFKMSLIKEFKHNRDGYTNAKTDFITKYSEIAKQLYKNKYSNEIE